MKKQIKFAPELISSILSGEKVSTWRLFDDKNLADGDILELLNKETLQHVATAQIIQVIEKPLGLLSDKDTRGHEKFNSDEEMYQTYKKYYNRSVDKDTIVKLIWFKLLSR